MPDYDYTVYIRVVGDDGPADTITVPSSDPMQAGYTALDWYPQEAERGQWLTPDDLEVVAIVRVEQPQPMIVRLDAPPCAHRE